MKALADFDLITVSAAGTDADTERDLFLEYGESLGFNTGFGGLDQELVTLPGDYAPPRGCLLLAKEGGEAAGCVGLRSSPGEGEASLNIRPIMRSPMRSPRPHLRLLSAPRLGEPGSRPD